MTIKIDLNPETAARLTAGAKARGVPVEKYAESLLRDAIGLHSVANGQLSVEELHAMLDAIAEGSENLPKVPTTAFSRVSFYEGRG